MAKDDVTTRVISTLSDRLQREAGFRPSRGPVLGADGDGTTNVLHAETGSSRRADGATDRQGPGNGSSALAEDRLAFGEKLIVIMAESVLENRINAGQNE